MEKKKGIMAEFKEFISRGSMVDLAIGVIVGGAFAKIVASLVNDIIMPALGFLVGRINFSDLKYVIRPATTETAEAAICYGNFIQNIVDFFLIAVVIFLFVRLVNRFRRKKKEAPAPVKPTEEALLLREIRDELKNNKK